MYVTIYTAKQGTEVLGAPGHLQTFPCLFTYFGLKNKYSNLIVLFALNEF